MVSDGRKELLVTASHQMKSSRKNVMSSSKLMASYEEVQLKPEQKRKRTSQTAQMDLPIKIRNVTGSVYSLSPYLRAPYLV